MSRALDVFGAFLRLGLTSFGGPVAHLGYFRRAFVEKRGWLSEAEYAELVALCQFLPGPASSQVGFAIGLRRAGFLGAFAAFVGFTAPSALLMVAAASNLDRFSTPAGTALAHGLKLVAASVVAHAVWSMGQGLLKGPPHWIAAAAGLAATLAAPGVAAAPLAILAAGAVFALSATGGGADAPAPAIERPAVMSGLAVFAGIGVALALSPFAALAGAMAKTGALVFGGGHVVLPLLEADAVGRGWLDESAFLAGYGAAQALPGPLFSFAAFIGAAQAGPIGGIAAVLAIFAPGLALVLLGLPLWARAKRSARAQGFAAGAGAAVVGVLAAALIDPVGTSTIQSPLDAAIALAGFAALVWLKAPTLAVVAAVAGAGAVVSAT